MKIIINFKDGRKAEFVGNFTISNDGDNTIITEETTNFTSLAAAVKAAREDITVLGVVKLLKINNKLFDNIISVLEMHATTGIETAQVWRKNNFKNNLIMTLFACEGYTCNNASKFLDNNNINIKLNPAQYSHLVNGIRGWEVVRELLNINVKQHRVDRAAIKAALEAGIKIPEICRIFKVSNSIVYEVRNGRKYTPRL